MYFIKSTINVFSFSGYNSLRVFSILISSALIVSFLELFSIGLVVAVLFGGEELAPFVNYINLFLGSLGLNLSEFQILISIIIIRLSDNLLSITIIIWFGLIDCSKIEISWYNKFFKFGLWTAITTEIIWSINI